MFGAAKAPLKTNLTKIHHVFADKRTVGEVICAGTTESVDTERYAEAAQLHGPLPVETPSAPSVKKFETAAVAEIHPDIPFELRHYLSLERHACVSHLKARKIIT